MPISPQFVNLLSAVVEGSVVVEVEALVEYIYGTVAAGRHCGIQHRS